MDILTGSAGVFDVGASVIQTLIAPTGVGAPDPFASYSFVLAGLTAGNSYLLRFAEVGNQNFFQMGVDNVAITVAAIPLPAAGILLASALALTGAIRRRGPAWG